MKLKKKIIIIVIIGLIAIMILGYKYYNAEKEIQKIERLENSTYNNKNN